MLLPLRPLPYYGESFHGYLLRLAAEHGRISVSSFLFDCGIPRTNRVNVDNDELIASVSEMTGHAASTIIKRCFPEELHCFTHSQDRCFHDLSIAKPRLCPQCMTEAPYLRAYWQYLPYTHCKTHHFTLIHSCPICQTDLAWSTDTLYGRCSQCGSDGSEMAEHLTPSNPIYHQTLEKMKTDSDRRTYVHDLLLTTQRALRPYDSELTSQERIPQRMADWSKLLTAAHRLLSEEQIIQEWLHGCAHYRRNLAPLGSTAVYAPILELTRKLKGSYAISRHLVPIRNVPATTSATSQMRNTFLQRPDDQCVKSTVDLRAMQRLFGCHAGDISLMVDIGAIAPAHQVALVRQLRFELSPIADAVITVENRHPSPCTPFVDVEFLLPLFLAKPGHLYAAVLTGNIRAGWGDRKFNLLDNLQVSTFDLLRFLMKYFRSLGDAEVTSSQVRSALRLPTRALQEIVSAGHLPSNSNRSTFRARDVYDFQRKYWTLPRFARMYGLSQPSVKEALARSQVQPYIGKLVYLRSPELRLAIKPLSRNTAIRTSISHIDFPSG